MPCTPLLRVLLFLSLIPFSACGSAESEARGLVIIEPANPDRPYYFDFDVVPEGEVREHTYVMANTDPRPITITKVQSSCGCTVPRVVATAPDGTQTFGRLFTNDEADVITVPVGGRLELTVTTDTRHVRVKNQHKLNTVRLTCDSENSPFLSFEQHLWVTLGFNATPLEIDLRLVPEGGGRAASTELFPAQAESKARITGVHSATEGLTVSFVEEKRHTGVVTIVTAELAPGMPRGPWLGEVRLDCTREDGVTAAPPFLIPVRGHVTTDVVCSPASLIFSPLNHETGAFAEAVVQALIPGERIAIKDCRLIGEMDGVKIEYSPDAPDSKGLSVRWNLRLSVGPEAAGTQAIGTLEIDTTVESAETLKVPVNGTFE